MALRGSTVKMSKGNRPAGIRGIETLREELKAYDPGFDVSIIGDADSNGLMNINVTNTTSGMNVSTYVQAKTDVNKTGLVWRIGNDVSDPDAYDIDGNNEVRSQMAWINPDFFTEIEGQGKNTKYQFSIQNSTKVLAEIFDSTNRDIIHQKPDDDATNEEILSRKLTEVQNTNNKELGKEMRASGGNMSVPLGERLGSVVNQKYKKRIIDPHTGMPVMVAPNSSEVMQAKRYIEKEMLGTTNLLNTQENLQTWVDDIETVENNGKQQARLVLRPFDMGDIIKLDPNSGAFMAPIANNGIGEVTRTYRRNSRTGELIYRDIAGREMKRDALTGQYPENAFPVTDSVSIESPVSASKSAGGKSKTYETEGVTTTPSTYEMQDVEDGRLEKGDPSKTTKRMVRVPVQAQKINDLNQDDMQNQVVYSNIRGSGESTSPVRIMQNLLFNPSGPTSGAGHVYGNFSGRNIDEYSQFRTKKIKMAGGITPANTAKSGMINVSMNMAEIIGDVKANPRSRFKLGTIGIVNQQTGKEEAFDMDIPELPGSQTNIHEFGLNIPKYTSASGDKWSSSGGNGFREVRQDEIDTILSRFPKGTNYRISAGISNVNGYIGYSARTAANISGGGLKAGWLFHTPVQVSAGNNTASMPIDISTAEVKAPLQLFREGIFGGRNTRTQKAILSDYLYSRSIQEDGKKESRQLRTASAERVNKWFDQFGSEYVMGWNDIRDFMNEGRDTLRSSFAVSKEILQSVFFQEDNGTAIDVNGAKNTRNIEEFKAGLTNSGAPLLGVSTDTVNLQYQSLARVMRDEAARSSTSIDPAGIAKKFREIFNYQTASVPGFFNGRQSFVNDNGEQVPSFMAQVATTMKAEYIGGGEDRGASPEVLRAIWEQSPALAKIIGYTPGEAGRKSKKNEALMDLARWRSIQTSSIRTDLADIVNDENNPNLFTVNRNSPELAQIQTTLAKYNPNESGSFDETIQALSGIAGGEDKQINFAGMMIFPKIGSAKTLGYDELGRQISGISRSFIDSLALTAEEFSMSEHNDEETNKEAGLATSEGLYKNINRLFEQHGDASKEMYRQNVGPSVALRFGEISWLNNNQGYMNDKTLRHTLKLNNFKPKEISKYMRLLNRSYEVYKKSGNEADLGRPYLGMRIPLKFGDKNAQDIRLVPTQYMKDMAFKLAGGDQARAEEMFNDPRMNDAIYLSSNFAPDQAGDTDFDPTWFVALDQLNKNDPHNPIVDVIKNNIAFARRKDPKQIERMEQQIYGVMQDNPDKIPELLAQIAPQLDAMKQALHPSVIFKSDKDFGLTLTPLNKYMQHSLSVRRSKLSGMGKTYNLRRSMVIPLTASDINKKGVNSVQEETQARYQTFLDALPLGEQQSGDKFSSMISAANIKADQYGNPYLSMSNGDEKSYERMYFNKQGTGLIENYAWMMQQLDAPLVNSENGKQYDITSDKMFISMAGANQKIRNTLYGKIRAFRKQESGKLKADPTYKMKEIDRPALALESIQQYISEGKDAQEVIDRTKFAVTHIAPVGGMMGNALAKHGYDANGNEIPGIYGEGAYQNLLLTKTEENGYGRNFGETALATAVYIGMNAKGDVPSAHILARANAVARDMQARTGSTKSELSDFIMNTNSLGGNTIANVNRFGYSTYQTNLERSYNQIRNLRSGSLQIDTETTGIDRTNPNSPNSKGFIWQIGFGDDPNPLTIDPEMSGADYRQNYQRLLDENNGVMQDFQKQMPTPEEVDAGYFKNSPTWMDAWLNHGVGAKILGAEKVTSYGRFDPVLIDQSFNRAEKAAQNDPKGLAVVKAEHEKFRKVQYVDLHKHLPEVFGEEIRNYNNDPTIQANRQTVGSSQEGILKALTWSGNRDRTAKYFTKDEIDKLDYHAAHDTALLHNANIDASILETITSGGIRKTEQYFDSIAQNNNFIDNARSRPRRITAPPLPPIIQQGSQRRVIRASTLENNPGTASGIVGIMGTMLSDQFRKNNLPTGQFDSPESITGHNVHDAAEDELIARGLAVKNVNTERQLRDYDVPNTNVTLTGKLDQYYPTSQTHQQDTDTIFDLKTAGDINDTDPARARLTQTELEKKRYQITAYGMLAQAEMNLPKLPKLGVIGYSRSVRRTGDTQGIAGTVANRVADFLLNNNTSDIQFIQPISQAEMEKRVTGISGVMDLLEPIVQSVFVEMQNPSSSYPAGAKLSVQRDWMQNQLVRNIDQSPTLKAWWDTNVSARNTANNYSSFSLGGNQMQFGMFPPSRGMKKELAEKIKMTLAHMKKAEPFLNSISYTAGDAESFAQGYAKAMGNLEGDNIESAESAYKATQLLGGIHKASRPLLNAVLESTDLNLSDDEKINLTTNPLYDITKNTTANANIRLTNEATKKSTKSFNKKSLSAIRKSERKYRDFFKTPEMKKLRQDYNDAISTGITEDEFFESRIYGLNRNPDESRAFLNFARSADELIDIQESSQKLKKNTMLSGLSNYLGNNEVMRQVIKDPVNNLISSNLGNYDAEIERISQEKLGLVANGRITDQARYDTHLSHEKFLSSARAKEDIEFKLETFKNLNPDYENMPRYKQMVGRYNTVLSGYQGRLSTYLKHQNDLDFNQGSYTKASFDELLQTPEYKGIVKDFDLQLAGGLKPHEALNMAIFGDENKRTVLRHLINSSTESTIKDSESLAQSSVPRLADAVNNYKNMTDEDILKAPKGLNGGEKLFDIDPVKLKTLNDELEKFSKNIMDNSKNISDARTRETRSAEMQVEAVDNISKKRKAEVSFEAVNERISQLKAGNNWENNPNREALTEAQMSLQSEVNKRTRIFKKNGKFSSMSGITDSEAEENRNREIEDQDRIESRSYGSFFRHMFGGFGLMYLRNVGNIAASPLREGYDARIKSQAEIGGSIFNLLGGRKEVNPDELVNRNEGLFLGGQGWEAIQKSKAEMIRSNPGVFAGLEQGVSGLSLFAATTWALGEMPNKRLLNPGYWNRPGYNGAEAWNSITDENVRKDSTNRALMGWASGAAMLGMTSTNLMNAYSAYTNPNVTSRAIVASQLSGGPGVGWDVLGGITSGAGMAIAGAGLGGALASPTGVGIPVGVGIGALAGGTLGFFSSQKNLLAYANPVIKSQVDRGTNFISSINGGAGFTQSFDNNYSPDQFNEAVSMYSFNLSANPMYADISQQSISTVASQNLRYGMNFSTNDIAALSRLNDRGVNLIDYSKNFTTLAGLGAYKFAQDSGKFNERETSYKAITKSDLVGGALFRDPKKNAKFNISASFVDGVYDNQQFNDMLAKNNVSITDQMNLGGQGSALSNIYIAPSTVANGKFDVWGQTSETGSIQRIGTTDNVDKTKTAIDKNFGEGATTTPITIGQDIVKGMLTEFEKNNSSIGTLMMDKLMAGGTKLAELGVVNTSNEQETRDDAARQKWKDRFLRASELGGTREEKMYASEMELFNAKVASGMANPKDVPDILKYKPGETSAKDAAEYIIRQKAQTDTQNIKNSMMANAITLNENFGLGSTLSLNSFRNALAPMKAPELSMVSSFFNTGSTVFGNQLLKNGELMKPVISEQMISAGLGDHKIDPRWLFTGGYMNMTDNNISYRVATTMGTGQGGNDFGWGGFDQDQSLANIFGADWTKNNPELLKVANGIAIPGGPIKLANGMTANKYYGMLGFQQEQKNNAWDYQQFQWGNQWAGMNLSDAYTHNQWSIENKQMQLGWAQQEFGFKMQEKQIALSTNQFNQNMGMQLKQVGMQRQWQQEDWTINQNIRDMQWGWKQEDFNEEKRFMTGRQRRLAERQMNRDTTMHNVEGDQIERQINRQKQNWQLEDERFAIQRQQFSENKKLQEEQLQASKHFFEQNKKLQLEAVQLNHKYYEEQHKLQVEAFNAAVAYGTKQHVIQETIDKINNSYQMNLNILQNIGQIGLAGINAQITQLTPKLAQMMKPFFDWYEKYYGFTSANPDSGVKAPVWDPTIDPKGDSSAGTAGTKKSASSSSAFLRTDTTISGNTRKVSSASSKQTINIHLGNELIKTFVIDTITAEVLHAH